MTKIGCFEFPDTNAEYAAWKPIVIHRALASKVLCVAVFRPERKWAAYVNAVPGRSHAKEAQKVAFGGVKMDERVARAVFTEIPAELPWAP